MNFKDLLINLILLSFLGSCSMNVDDKNADLNDKEKKSLKSDKENSLKVSTIKFIGQDEIREDNTAGSNIIGKYYTVEVCLEDKNISNGLGNKKIDIEGEVLTTNASGCVEWSHEIKIDPTVSDRCSVYSKSIKIAGKSPRTVNYSIDYYSNEISNLDRSRGCITEDKNKKSVNNKIQPIEMNDIFINFGGNLSKHASDKKYITHAPKITACLVVSMTNKRLINTKFKMVAVNKETGEESIAEPQGDQIIETNGRGCFKTDYITKFEQYLYSHWMPVELKLEIISGSLKGTKIKRLIHVNPWEPNRALYGEGFKGYIPTKTSIDQKYARFYMDGVMYIQIGNDNKKMAVNDYLGLTISKTYQIVLNPYINRFHKYSPSEKHARERVMADGRFKLSLVLLAPKAGDMGIDKDNYENFEYITGAEEVVEVKNGVINKVVNIPFKVKDLPRLALKTMSIFKLEPIEDIGLRPSIVTGFFKARIPWIKTNVLQDAGLNYSDRITDTWNEHELKHGKDFDLSSVDKSCSKKNEKEVEECLSSMREITENNITHETIKYRSFVDDMFAKLSTENKQKKLGFKMKVSPKKIYVNHLNKNIKDLQIYKSAEAASKLDINVTKEDFNELFPDNLTYHHFTENLAEEICRYAFHKDRGAYTQIFGYFYKRTNYDKCLNNPYKYFGIKSARHVEKLHGYESKRSYSDGFAIFVGDNFNANDGKSESFTEAETYSVGADIGGKLPIPLFNEFLNIGFKAGVTKSYSNSKSDFKGFNLSENVGTSKGLSVEKFVTKINADFERCILIQSRDFLDSKKVLKDQKNVYLPLSSGGAYVNINEAIDMDDPKYQSNFGINFYICDDNAVNEKFREAWYFVQSRIESSLGIDPDNGNERVILKAFRGTLNYFELRQGLRDAKNISLISDSIGYGTPEESLVKNWGHLIKGGIPKEDSAQFLLDHMEGSFPGTIEGNGAAVKPFASF